MYDYEIQDEINKGNGVLKSSIYEEIIKTSPQLDHIHFEAFGNYFQMWSNEGTEFKFSVEYDGEPW